MDKKLHSTVPEEYNYLSMTNMPASSMENPVYSNTLLQK